MTESHKKLDLPPQEASDVRLPRAPQVSTPGPKSTGVSNSPETDRSTPRSASILDTSEFSDLKLHNAFAARLLAFTKKRLPGNLKAVVDAEGIVQETFLTYFRGIQSEQFESTENGDEWPLLAAICRRKLLEHLQWHGRIKRNTRGQVHFSNLETDSSDGLQVAHRQHTASREFRIGEVHTRVRDLLTDREREINDARMDGLSDQELQQRFGCTERTIRRAVARFRQLLEQELQQSSPHFFVREPADADLKIS